MDNTTRNNHIRSLVITNFKLKCKTRLLFNGGHTAFILTFSISNTEQVTSTCKYVVSEFFVDIA